MADLEETPSITINGVTYRKRWYGQDWYYTDSWGDNHDVMTYMVDALEYIIQLRSTLTQTPEN